jgi:hypothetical protein
VFKLSLRTVDCFLQFFLAPFWLVGIVPLILLATPQLLATLKVEAAHLPSASFVVARPSTAAAHKQALSVQAGMVLDPAFMDAEGLVTAMAALQPWSGLCARWWLKGRSSPSPRWR